jgi:hypothetical protein
MREICMSGSMRGMWRRSHGQDSKAPPIERGGKQICQTYRHRATSLLYPMRVSRLVLPGLPSDNNCLPESGQKPKSATGQTSDLYETPTVTSVVVSYARPKKTEKA